MVCHNNDIFFVNFFVGFDCLKNDFFGFGFVKIFTFCCFSFPNCNFNVDSSCFMVTITITDYRFRFGMSPWIETKPCNEEGRHEQNNETCCLVKFNPIVEAFSRVFCHFSKNSFNLFWLC